ncbi:MAG: AAA family ATPase, partial [Candidatus Limnocylindrales bacterium]
MRIDEIAVDGFGLLRDRRLEPAPGLTLIRGENEAGKSTILAFIRAILFGFDPKSPGALAGGRRGGWLIVRPADGHPIRVERYGTTGGGGQLRLLDDDGDDLGADRLGRILQGVEKAVYRNIFAFGLAELTEFETLTGPAIADRIYGAGMGTGATSVVEVENAFEKVRSEIFVQRGRVPRINVLLAEIDDLESRIEASNAPEEFREAGQRRSELELELAALNDQAASSAIERQRLERLRDGWSAWLALESARDRLLELPAETSSGAASSPDLLERLVRTERDLAGLGERHGELSALADQATRERDRLVIDERLLAARPTAEALLSDLGEARADRARLVDRERDLSERSAAVAEAVRRLGPGWDETRIADIDDSLEAQGAISGQFRSLLEAAERDVAAARTAASSADQNQSDARAELEAIAPPGSIGPLRAMPVGSAGRTPAASRRFVSLPWLLIGLLVGLAGGEAGLLVGLGDLPAGVVGLVAAIVTALAGSVLGGQPTQLAITTGATDGSLAARVAERTERLHILEERNAAAQERLVQAREASARASEAWQGWLIAHGLPAEVDRETAARLLDGVRAVRTGLLGLGTAQDRRAETAARLTDFEDRGAAFLAGLGRPVDDPIAGLEAVRRDLGATLGAAGT